MRFLASSKRHERQFRHIPDARNFVLAAMILLVTSVFPSDADTANPRPPSSNEQLITLIEQTEYSEATSLLRLLEDPDANAILNGGAQGEGQGQLDRTVREYATARIAVGEGRCNDALSALGVDASTPSLMSQNEAMLPSDNSLELTTIDALVVCGRYQGAEALSAQLMQRWKDIPTGNGDPRVTAANPIGSRQAANWIRVRLTSARAHFAAGNLGAARNALLDVDRAYYEWKGFNQETIDYLTVFGAIYEFTGDLDRATEFLLSARTLSQQLSTFSYKTCELQLALAEIGISAAAAGTDRNGSHAELLQGAADLLKDVDERLRHIPGAVNLRIKAIRLKASALVVPAYPYIDLSRDVSTGRQDYLNALALLQDGEETARSASLWSGSIGAEMRAYRAFVNLRLKESEATIAAAIAATEEADKLLMPNDPRRIPYLAIMGEAVSSTAGKKINQDTVKGLSKTATSLAQASLQQWFADYSTPRERETYSNSYPVRAALRRLVELHPSTDIRWEYEALAGLKGSSHRSEQAALQGALSDGRQGEDDLNALRRTQRDETMEVYLFSGQLDPTEYDYVYPTRTTTAWRRLSQHFLPTGVLDSAMTLRLGDIQGKMNAGDVVVDFFRVNMLGDDLTLAYIFGSAGNPLRVTIAGSEWIQKMDHVVGLLGDESRSLSDPELHQELDAVSKQAWAQVEATIRKADKNARHIYLVPDGDLAAVPFELLSTGDADASLVGDRYEVAYLTGAGDLIQQSDPAIASTGAMIVADVDYGPREGLWALASGTPRGLAFEPLDSSAGEASSIAGIFKAAGLAPPVELVKSNATTQAVGATMGSYGLVHFATRATAIDTSSFSRFYGVRGRQPNYNSQGPPQGPNAVLAGIVSPEGVTYEGPGAEFDPFVGVAVALTGANPRREGNNFGLLSMADLALLDLRRVKLVVLPAAEAPVAMLLHDSGVHSLGLAFGCAGAKQIVARRFISGDAQAGMFIRFFYGALIAGQTPAAALRSARNALRAEVDATGNHDLKYPKTWASFITYGSQMPLFPVRH